MDSSRSRQINTVLSASRGPIVYWMSRDQRVRDNWALLYAQKEAIKQKVPLVVLFCFVPYFFAGTLRQYGFMLRGLPFIESDLRKKNIPFFFLSGEPKEVIPAFLQRVKAGVLYTDFSPLRTKKRWLKEVLQETNVPIYEVDAHNIIPCWKLFSEQVKSAKIFRIQLRSSISVFLNAFPAVRKHPVSFQRNVPVIAWDSIMKTLPLDTSVAEVKWSYSGEAYAQKAFRIFLKQKIREYKSGEMRSGMRGEWQWRLRPYIHFGQLSVQKIAWSVMHSETDPRFKALLLESLITRRELSDHFCHYNTHYDSVDGFPKWARETFEKHRHDTRKYIYSKRVLESAGTHDSLWNTLQQELVSSGRMFGWARRYWAKRMLEWTRSPEEALQIAMIFTEKYSLSGWDTSSYLAIVRAIGGVYDNPDKTERLVFGTVPYIQPEHCKKAQRDFRTYAGKV